MQANITCISKVVDATSTQFLANSISIIKNASRFLGKAMMRSEEAKKENT